jgi:hypothetical protein
VVAIFVNQDSGYVHSYHVRGRSAAPDDAREDLQSNRYNITCSFPSCTSFSTNSLSSLHKFELLSMADKFFSVAFFDFKGTPSSNLAMRHRMTNEIKNTVNSHRVSENEFYYYFKSYWNSKPHSSQIDGRWSQPVIFDLSQSRFSLLFL